MKILNFFQRVLFIEPNLQQDNLTQQSTADATSLIHGNALLLVSVSLSGLEMPRPELLLLCSAPSSYGTRRSCTFFCSTSTSARTE